MGFFPVTIERVTYSSASSAGQRERPGQAGLTCDPAVDRTASSHFRILIFFPSLLHPFSRRNQAKNLALIFRHRRSRETAPFCSNGPIDSFSSFRLFLPLSLSPSPSSCFFLSLPHSPVCREPMVPSPKNCLCIH